MGVCGSKEENGAANEASDEAERLESTGSDHPDGLPPPPPEDNLMLAREDLLRSAP